MSQYFNNKQLGLLKKEFKTVPVDGDGHAQPVEYSEKYVRGTILKLLADIDVNHEWIATVIRYYHHALPYDVIQAGLAIVKVEAGEAADQ